MKIRNWAKFALLTLILFAAVLIFIYRAEILNAVIAFPIDWLVSFLLGAATMFVANLRLRRHNRRSRHPNEDEISNE